MFLSIEKHAPNQCALLDSKGQSVSYGQLVESCKKIELPQPKRSLVFCLCRNTIGCISGYVGLLSQQAVPLMLDSSLKPAMVRELIQQYRPSALWLPQELRKDYPEFCVRLQLKEYALLDTGYESPPMFQKLALLLTTSGSTGSPKLVRQSMENLFSNAQAIAEYLELTPSERAITVLPLHYTYGLSILHSHLLTGATLLLTEHSVVQQEFWDFFEEAQATSLSGVPITYTLLERAGFFERPLPSLRYFTQAGGKLPHTMHSRCAAFAAKRNIRFYAMYGQTEATARMSYLPWDMAAKKCGSIGIAIPGGTFQLIAEDGQEITETNREGELIYRGANVTLGYAENALDLCNEDDWAGVLATGDLAYRDEDGYYYITGRKKRFLKLYGNRVSLDECERLIRETFPQLDCACVGTDDHLKIYLTAQTQEQAKEVTLHLARTLRFPAKAFSAVFCSQIPRNPAGKIQYTQLEVQ